MTENDEQSFLNISIKEEPLDDYGLSENILGDVKIKEELEDECVAEEPFLSHSNSNNDSLVSTTSVTIVTNSNIEGNKSPLTSQVSETNNGTVKFSRNSSGVANISVLKVQCPRCKVTVVLEQFRRHIDSCPPRKSAAKRSSKIDGFDGSTNSLNNNEQRVDLPLPDSTVEQTQLEARNGSLIQARRTRSKSCHEISFCNYEMVEQPKGPSRRSRSKSIYKETQLESGKSLEVKPIEYHTNETAQHQKPLDIRSNSVSNNIVLSTKPISSEENEDQSIGDSKMTDQSAIAIDDSLLLEDNTFSCSMCSFTTDKQRSLRDHERNHKKTSSRIFQCIYCNQKYTRYALYLHIQDVHPGQKFEIAEDDHAKESNGALTSRSKNSLKDLKTHFGERRQKNDAIPIFKCTQCSYMAKQRDVLKHENVHRLGLPIIKCSWCNFFSTVLAVRFHEKTCEKNEANAAKVKLHEKTAEKNEINSVKTNLHEKTDEQNENNPFCKTKCPKCSYTCNIKNKLERHIRVHKQNKPILPCPNNCGFKSTSVALKAHFKKCRQTGNTKSISLRINGKTFKCLKCPFSTNLRIKLNFHYMKRHCESTKPSVSTRRAFKCSICSFSATIQRHLDMHMKKHESSATLGQTSDKLDMSSVRKSSTVSGAGLLERKKSQFKCPHCLFLTNLRIKLNIHMKTHDVDSQVYKKNKDDIPEKVSDTELSLLRCTKCTFTTDIPSELKAHIKMPHINLFHCKLCSAVFDRQSYLQKHMGQHGLNKPIWKCPFCDFISSLKCFTAHMRKHLKADPSLQWFRCKLCSFVATKSWNLSRHLKAHKSRQPVTKCPFCFYSSTPRQLADHIMQHNIRATKENNFYESNKKQTNATVETSVELPTSKPSTHSEREPIKHSPKVVTSKPESTTELNKFFGELSSPTLRNLGKRKLLKCKFCSLDGMTVSCLKSHLQAHIREQTIKQCRYCSFKSTFNSLLRHIYKHHPREKQLKVSKLANSSSRDDLKQPTKPTSRSLSHKIQANINKETIVENEVLQKTPKLTKNPVIKSKLLKCRSCSASCRTEASLKLHMQAHINKQPIKQCRLCNFKSTPRYLLYHMVKHKEITIQDKEQELFKCKSCSFVALKYKYLQSHIRTHLHKKPVKKCPHCAFKSTPSCLREHMNLHYDSTPAIQKDTIDDISNQKSTSLNNDTYSSSIKRKRHRKSETTNIERKKVISKEISNKKVKKINEKNNESPGFHCPQCPYSTHLRIKLNIHKRKRHGDEEINNTKRRKLDNQSGTSCLLFDSDRQGTKKDTPSKEGIFHCSYCSFTSLLKSSWKKHLSSHMTYNLPILQCQYCSFKGNLNMFRSHEKNCAYASDEPKRNSPQKILLNCAKCSFTTYFPATLESHKINDHTTDTKSIQNLGAIKSFKCEYCSFSSYWQYLIERHQLSHTILKLPIEQCPNCDFRSTTAALQAHVNKCNKNLQQRAPSDSLENK